MAAIAAVLFLSLASPLGAGFSLPLFSFAALPLSPLHRDATTPALTIAAPATPQSKTPPKQSTSRRTTTRAQQAPTAERIREIQGALAEAGFYEGQPTGKWDAPTVEAMKRFQESKGLNPTGKIDARTLQALDLGSDVAGKAPPKPREDTDNKP